MTGFMGFVRAFSVLIAALLLSLGVALPAGAASSNTQQVTRSRRYHRPVPTR